jgi:hypothetical protein
VIQETQIRNRLDAHWTIWKDAVLWGGGVALIHRLILQLWAATTWLMVGRYFHATAHDLQLPNGSSMPLQGIEDTVFGVWRRWDAIHYLRLAQEGYNQSTLDLSVFPPLAPIGFRLFDAILPGRLDFSAMVFNTLMFAIALMFLFRLCEVYFQDQALAKWAVCVFALLPLSYFFAAPMAESVYLAATLGTIYYATQGRWLGSGVCGFLASAARTQGALLIVPVSIILLSSTWDRTKDWRTNILNVARTSIPLVLIPAGFVLFLLYRQSLGLPSMTDIYAEYSLSMFTNPIQGLWINIRWFFVNLPRTLIDSNAITLIVTLILLPQLFLQKQHRHLPLIVYTLIYFLLFVSTIYIANPDVNVVSTLSIGRYSLVLFPLTILLADLLRQAARPLRIAGITGLGISLLLLTALNTVGMTGP